MLREWQLAPRPMGVRDHRCHRLRCLALQHEVPPEKEAQEGRKQLDDEMSVDKNWKR